MIVVFLRSGSPVASPAVARATAVAGSPEAESPEVLGARASHRCRGAAETPLLALLGLGLFCWIFLTNSLPAKRELAGRLAQVERYTAEEGQLARLKEQLAEEEGLARAVREDAVVRRALFLLEHPTAPENAPEHLLTTFSMDLPEEPENLVQIEVPLEEELPLEESDSENQGEIPATGGDSPNGSGAPSTEESRTAGSGAEQREKIPSPPKEKTKSERTKPDSAKPDNAQPNKADKAKTEKNRTEKSGSQVAGGGKTKPRESAGETRRANPSTTPSREAGSSKSNDARRGTVADGPKAGSKTPTLPKPAKNLAKPAKNLATPAKTPAAKPPGSFEVPSFLRG